MRVPIAIAVSAAGLVAGVVAAAAADLPFHPSERFSVIGRVAAPLVIYQYEPGIVVRAYWLPPWRHRHYFPATGEMPDVGREEDLSVIDPPERAESFERSWSTSAAFVHRRPRLAPLPPFK